VAPGPGFTRPSLAWFAVLDGGIVALSALALSEPAHAAASEVVPLPSRPVLRGLLAVTAALHVGEALYAGRLARRHGLPAGRWARQTLVVGFPSTLALRRTVRTA
jgi:hypothetical protein